MIVTVTPNPSVDRTIEIASLHPGEVHRALSTRVDPGGKGVNVSRALSVHGGATRAVFPVGGAHGRLMTELLDPTGTPYSAVPITGAIRANVALVEPNGTTTKINEPGPVLTDDEAAAFLRAVGDAVGGLEDAWIVGCGSLPGGLPGDFYAGLTTLARDIGAHVAIDASGAPLAASVPAGPDLIKPNRVELGELVGADLGTVGDVVAAARDLIDGGVGRLLVSLGRDGALLVTNETVALAAATVDRPVSTVGAGDCTLAGYLLAITQGASDTAALEQAVAFGAAAVALPGTEVPSPRDISSVRVRLDLDPDRTLTLTD